MFDNIKRGECKRTKNMLAQSQLKKLPINANPFNDDETEFQCLNKLWKSSVCAHTVYSTIFLDNF